MLFSSTARAYGFDDELYNKVPIECRDRNEDINIQAMCLKEHFFFGGNPVHPKIIEDMISWISDSGDQTVAINLEDSQGSNKYNFYKGLSAFISYKCKRKFYVCDKPENRIQWVEIEHDEGSFHYYFHGVSDNGIMVLETAESGGGSGVFQQLMLFRIKEVAVLELQHDTLEKDISWSPSTDYGYEILKSKNSRISKSDKKRIYLEKVYKFLLGDRNYHSVSIDNNFLVLDGSRIDLTPLSNF
jgi:hypothetical protein